MPLTPEVFKRWTGGIHGGHSGSLHGGDIATRGYAFERGDTYSSPTTAYTFSPMYAYGYMSITGSPGLILSGFNNQMTTGEFKVRI